MKKRLLKYLGCAMAIQAAVACTPNSYTYHDNSGVDVSRLDSVVLMPNHVMVLADGHACLDLYPRLYAQGDSIIDSRVTEDMLEYTSSSGVKMTRYFTTSDASLIGKNLTVQVKIKGTDIVSKPVSFRVVAPLDERYREEITIPVVFHIVQTSKEIESHGGKYNGELIAMHLNKLNNLFSGAVSTNPAGVDTRVRFAFAMYDPDGKKMNEPGINRYLAPKIDFNDIESFLTKSLLVWPSDRYMNIWLVSDYTGELATPVFADKITKQCLPTYMNPGVSGEGRPEGITWTEYPDGTVLSPKEMGIIYKLQEMDNQNRVFDVTGNGTEPMNELAYYVGRYLGLLQTFTYSLVDYEDNGFTDYCGDTQDYFGKSGSGKNDGWYKQVKGCYFRSENIADDPTGLHVSVSKEQCERIRWVLENSPQRAAWKSNYAFTGK